MTHQNRELLRPDVCVLAAHQHQNVGIHRADIAQLTVLVPAGTPHRTIAAGRHQMVITAGDHQGILITLLGRGNQRGIPHLIMGGIERGLAFYVLTPCIKFVHGIFVGLRSRLDYGSAKGIACSNIHHIAQLLVFPRLVGSAHSNLDQRCRTGGFGTTAHHTYLAIVVSAGCPDIPVLIQDQQMLHSLHRYGLTVLAIHPILNVVGMGSDLHRLVGRIIACSSQSRCLGDIRAGQVTG